MATVPHEERPIYVENLDRDYYLSDTSAVERHPTSGRETWLNIAVIPSTPPALAPFPGGPVVGDVRGIQGVPLAQVLGNPYRYAYQGAPPQQFADMVPANYASGAYTPALRDSDGRPIPYNPKVYWVADGLLGVVEFKYSTPQELGYVPPFELDYWRYVGPVVETSGTFANVGNGAQVYKGGSSNPSLLRTLVADPGAGMGGLVVTQNPTEIAIGNSLMGASLGGTAAVFANKTGATLNLRGISAGAGLTVTQNATNITIENTLTDELEELRLDLARVKAENNALAARLAAVEILLASMCGTD